MSFEYHFERRPCFAIPAFPGKNDPVKKPGIHVAGVFPELVTQQFQSFRSLLVSGQEAGPDYQIVLLGQQRAGKKKED
jgi:hypothetical protein